MKPDIQPKREPHRHYTQSDERCSISVDVRYKHTPPQKLPREYQQVGDLLEAIAPPISGLRIVVELDDHSGGAIRRIELTSHEFDMMVRSVARVLPRDRSRGGHGFIAEQR